MARTHPWRPAGAGFGALRPCTNCTVSVRFNGGNRRAGNGAYRGSVAEQGITGPSGVGGRARVDAANALSACVPPHDLAPLAREEPIRAREASCRRDVLACKALARARVSACLDGTRHRRTTEPFRSFAGRRIDGRGVHRTHHRSTESRPTKRPSTSSREVDGQRAAAIRVQAGTAKLTLGVRYFAAAPIAYTTEPSVSSRLKTAGRLQ